MSLRSSNSKSTKSYLDPEALLDDGDLDYEPDWLENNGHNDEDRMQIPEPSGQDFQETFSNPPSSPNISRIISCAAKETTPSSIASFRDHMNYMDMHVAEEKDSCRNNFGRYLKISKSFHLDSSDEDDEPEFSDGGSQITDYTFPETNRELQNETDYAQSIEPLADPDYIEPESPVAPEYQYFHLQEYNSDSSTYENRINFQNLMDSPSNRISDIQQFNQSPAPVESPLQDTPGITLPKNPARKSLNFTVKVVGDSRFRLPFKKKQKPWTTSMQNYLLHIVSLNSMDEVIKFCPEVESRASTFSLESSERSSSIQSSLKTIGMFKVPLKRPPTRQKCSSKNLSVSIDGRGTISVKEPEDNCDIISLTASTNIGDYQEEAHEPFNAEVKSEQPSTTESQANLEQTKMTRIAEWIETHTTTTTEVPAIFKGLCYKYFFSDNCTNRMCKNSHLLVSPLTKIGRIELLPDNLLNDAYNFAKSNPFFFSKIYRVFAETFRKRDNKAELISMVNVIFEYDKINKKEALKIILENLERTDLGTFACAVDYLLLEVGLRSFPNLGETLLEIIICMDNLPSHWPLLRKLFIAGEKIPFKLASKFLVNLMRDPVDFKVCHDVYLHILKYKCLDMPQIPVSIREPFLKLSSMEEKQRLSDGTNFPVNSTNHDLINPGPISIINNTDFSVPPPNFLPVDRTENAFSQPKNFIIRPLPATNYPRTAPVDDRSNIEPSLDIPIGFSIESRQQVEPMSRSRTIPPRNFTIDASVNPYANVPRSDNGKSCENSNPPPPQDRSSETDSSGGQDFLYFNPTADFSYLPAMMTYNKEGLQYDPANDYIPPPKRSQAKSAPLQKRLKTTPAEAFEPLVSSSSDPQSRKEKVCLPEHPVFGTLYFDPNYVFNVSLHNLYLQQIDNVDIDEDDVHRLNDCIKQGNGRQFLELMRKYSGPVTIQNFISMTLAHLKGFMGPIVGRMYQILLASIEECNPYFYGDVKTRVILEVITMNLLFELEKRTLFREATDLLMKFSNWDSLITSRLFITDMQTGVSIVGRYFFIAKLLSFTKPELTYEILVCPNFRFLESYDNWPYIPPFPTQDICTSDLVTRNRVLTSFLNRGFFLNTLATIELYKTALKSKNGIWSFNVRPFINTMVVKLVNEEQIIPLKQIYNEIDLFFSFMEKNSIRGFLIVMYPYLNNSDKFRLFEKCFPRNIYKNFVGRQGLQHNIEIKTDMDRCEIELIIIYYFHKLLELRNIPSGSECLKFEIKLPGESTKKSIEILNKNKSLLEVKTIISQILKSKCSVECNIMYQSNIVNVTKSELINYIENTGNINREVPL